MNGEPLPLRHGFPARLVTPGVYGYVGSTKWLTELEVTTFDAFDQYWVPRGYAEQAPIKTMTRIDTPRSFERVPAGRVVVGGVAWAQTRGIEQVEISIDGEPFRAVELGAARERRHLAPVAPRVGRRSGPPHARRPSHGRHRGAADRGPVRAPARRRQRLDVAGRPGRRQRHKRIPTKPIPNHLRYHDDPFPHRPRHRRPVRPHAARCRVLR